ncbi:MAG: M20/M25/M40 family metallo-hydrolase [Gemmatimonadota bacterium]|nr:MAG: M20/M25/M40 family metallo-hydrolase [Gemmatimonadota bacterium]
MKGTSLSLLVGVGMMLSQAQATAQSFPTDDPVIKAIWQEGMVNSQAYNIAQVMMDSIGPRLSGSPALKAANEWAVMKFEEWGIPASNEQYGTWMSWRRGISHVDLIQPWVRSLTGMMLAWSPGTDGKVEGPVVAMPEFENKQAFDAWLPTVEGKFVLTSMYQPTCRPNTSWEEHGTEESFEKMSAARDTARNSWSAKSRALRTALGSSVDLALEEAGALGLFSSSWAGGWGATRIFSASTERIPAFSLTCEDYGLLHRLAQNGQGPVVRVEAEAENLGVQPIFNTIAEIRGSERPDEYILFSAHFDSWDGGTGATDNGTGSVIMMEAARILKTVYPNPKRTIIIGLWGAEEQGLIGSRAFAEQHPEVLQGLQAVFNQDNGTGRVARVSMQGLTGASPHFANWLSAVPRDITRHISLDFPGTPGGGGSDYASFICGGAPTFSLSSLSFDYGYTWHTNYDTLDKIVFDDVMNNATLTAMLAYMASEDPETVSRDQRVMPVNPRTGEQMTWPVCRSPRTWEEYRGR